MKENETNKERIAGTVVQTKNVFDFSPVNSEMCVPVLYDYRRFMRALTLMQ